MTNENHGPDGKFAKGNTVARTTGLYVRVKLAKGEEIRVRRVRRYLRDAGLPDDMAATMALVWLNSTRVVEAFTRIEDDGERFAQFDLFERATRLALHVLGRRDRALEEGDGPDEFGDALLRATGGGA